MTAREEILAHLRAELSRTDDLFRHAKIRHETPTVPSAVTEATGDRLALARQFGAKLEAIHGGFEIAQGPESVPTRVTQLVKRWNRDGDRVLSWAASELHVPDLTPRLEQAGISFYVPDDMHEEECRRNAAHLSVGITGVEAAFAGTGSIALLPGKGKSRAAALLTLYHIAVIPFSCIYPSIEAWMEVARKEGNLDDRVRRGSQLAFVTGPSKSADIELNLTLGVHGPKMVHAVIFDDG